MTNLKNKNDKFLTEKHKLHWHSERVSDWSKSKSIAPLYIDMGITQTCNIHCQYCYYAVPENRTTKTITTENLINAPVFNRIISKYSSRVIAVFCCMSKSNC